MKISTTLCTILIMLLVFVPVVFTTCESEARQSRMAEERNYYAEYKKRQEIQKKAKLAEERRMLAEERKKLAEERKKLEALEKQIVRERLLDEIFPKEAKLSETARARGWSLLIDFGNAHMPKLTERCVNSQREMHRAKSNLDKLVATMTAENAELETNTVYNDAKNRWLDFAAEYWWLRYMLTDNYSAYKFGLLTSEGLAAKDEELATPLGTKSTTDDEASVQTLHSEYRRIPMVSL